MNPIREVQEADVGKPLTWLVGRNEVLLIEDGRVDLTYLIKYAGGGEDSVSAQQTLRIVAPSLPRLPAPTIDDHGGGALDPEHFRGGATLRFALHPDARVGDMLMLYTTVSSGTPMFDAIQLDPSSLDSGSLTLRLNYSWLVANNGKSAELIYQFARAGTVLSGEPLRLLVRKPLVLPQAVISDMSAEPGDEPNEGTMDAGDTTTGSQSRVPNEAVVGDSDKISLHWGEPGTPGSSEITVPVGGDWRAFHIPKNAIAMNMGAGVDTRDRLKVFYRVVPIDEPPENYQDSKPFFLKIVPFPQSRFPTIQCMQAQGTGGVLSLASVTDPKGTEFRLGRWAYIAEEQILNIKVFGKEDYLLKDHRVTKAEAEAPHVSSWLLKSYLQTQVGVGNKLKVTVTVSFDEGRTHIAFANSPEVTLSA
ncbi:hypothetical protein CES87_04345 [Pseudomonas sp. ERMR1:02]|nr:hypothetical protein CES87_04345 [Pseudomonas sp. ERMR1:02]